VASEVQICNRALQRLGVKRITSLTEDSRNARACNAAYTDLRDFELREHPWSFAAKRASIAADATGPIFNKDNYFTLPSDYIRMLPIDPEYNLNSQDWIIEGKKIATNDGAPLKIRYIYRVTDPNEMDSQFREALSAKIAWELAEELTQSSAKGDRALRDYEKIIAQAKHTNAILREAQQPPDDTWITVRS
jgi:hypothetical protein